MHLLTTGTIRQILTTLVILAMLPALLIILYSGLEQRREAIDKAEREVLLLAQSMGEVQKGIIHATRQTLATLAQMSEIQNQDGPACSAIFQSVIANNPYYLNLAAVDMKGEVFASARPFEKTNLADRRHIQRAIADKKFTEGGYIVTRVGQSRPALAFAHPVLDRRGEVRGVITTAIGLEGFGNLFDLAQLPPDSFVAVTDSQGIRLFYYPAREQTNPIGGRIVDQVWEMVRTAQGAGISRHAGSDGVQRIFAFLPVYLEDRTSPYIYMWAGMPEALVVQPANRMLVRDFVLIVLAAVLALAISWTVGGQVLHGPINRLLATARAFGRGDLKARSGTQPMPVELSGLAAAFDEMADALVQGQERLRTIADFTYDWEYWIGPDNRLLWMSPSSHRITGYTAEEFMADHGLIESIIHESDRFRFQQHLRLETEDARGDHLDYRIRHKAGRTVWINHHCLPIRHADGRVLGRRVSNRDITDRKRMEQRAQESEAQFRSLVEGAPEAIFVQDDQPSFIYVNAAALKLYGAQSPDQLLGTSIFDRFHPDCHADIRRRIHLLHRDKQIVARRERVCLRLDGSAVSVEVSAVPIVFGGQGCSLVFVQDITERKQIEARLQQAQKMEAIGVLAGGIAHDFNNILFPIMGLAELLADDLPDGSAQRQNALEIVKSARRAGDLVNQILSFSRQAEHKRIPIRFQNVLDEVIKLARATIPSNITIHHEANDDCGAVLADPTHLHQVAMNLITNAYHAVEQKGGRIDVQLRRVDLERKDLPDPAMAPGPYVRLTVSDTGDGISAQLLPRIFDPYFTTKPQGKGTGLGLSVVYGIIRKLGGEIRVQSAIGRGTAFHVYLPLFQRDEVPAPPAPSDALPTGGERILLVDDEEAIVKMEKQMLERLGYQVSIHLKGLDALQEFETDPSAFDLVITDMAMPDMTGAALARRMIAVRSDIPVILCTGFSENMTASKAREMGIRGFLMKPLTREHLARKVRQVLDQAGVDSG